VKEIPIRQLNPSYKELNLSESFTIRKLEDLFEGANMIDTLHRHDFYFILILKKGSGNHEIDFINYKISDYSIFIIRPGQVHKLELKKDSIGFIMQFNIEFYYPIGKKEGALLKNTRTKNFHQLNQDSFSKISVLLNSIFNEYQNKPEQFIEVIKSNLKILFIELTRLKSSTGQNLNYQAQYMQERLEEFLKFLETNIYNKKQVTQYAEMLNLSNYQLNAITKQLLGKTASEIINEQIILESKRYLLVTSNQVNHIAHHLGYEDVSYFIRFFKKYTGHSPNAFRENFK